MKKIVFTILFVLLGSQFSAVATRTVEAATTVNYGDVTLAATYTATNWNDVWDLTKGDLTLSYTIDMNGVTQPAPWLTSWTEVGLRTQGAGNFNPGPFGVYQGCCGGWMTSSVGDLTPSPGILSLHEKFDLQASGGRGEGDYDCIDANTVVGPIGTWDNYGIWFDRDTVDQWQATYWGAVNGGTYSTGGVYHVIIYYHAINLGLGSMFATVNGIQTGFYTAGWKNAQPEIYPAGLSFKGDMTRMQVFAGIYGADPSYGSTTVHDLTLSGELGISSPLIADFTYSPSGVVVGDTIEFFDETHGGSTPYSSWSWDLNGDSVIDSTDQSPTYVYTTPGDYNVKLTVKGHFACCESASITKTIHVYATPAVRAALWISPKKNVFSGPCAVSNTFAIDVNLFNLKSMTGLGVFAYDFTVSWSNNTGTLSESMISLKKIDVHIPWPTGSYFIVANETYTDAAGISYYHLAITAIGGPELELTNFQASLVTLTFHIDNEPCWPIKYYNTFHLHDVSMSTQCTIPITLIELDEATYELDSAQPNIELVPGPNEKGLNTESGPSINETFIGNTHVVQIVLTNVTKAYGFSFVLTYDPFYWKIDCQHIILCASFPPPYETLTIDADTPGLVHFILQKPCEKPAACGAEVCAVSFGFVSTSPDVGFIPTPHTGAFCLTSVSVYAKCPALTEYSIQNGGLLYGGCLPFYWGPCKTDITLDGKTDIADLSALAKKYDMTHPWGALAASGDMTKVDIYDFVQVAKHFGVCPDP